MLFSIAGFLLLAMFLHLTPDDAVKQGYTVEKILNQLNHLKISTLKPVRRLGIKRQNLQ